ncbi:Chromosome partitioning protein ParA [invertebrate metagenome]|uniref:Chromosome partitioning protein ParA n=1 Tax=invertebrate metagenome TaxID=1711999 RepID=A0A2H9T2Z7_9ZZZZ
MSKILAITNQKGGVGKTTSCINLAASLAASGKCVLLVDMDPQGNASMGSGVNKHQLEKSVYHVLTGRCDIKDAIYKSVDAGFDVLPSNGDLTAAEVELMALENKESRLKSALESVSDLYGFVLIDCPPSLNMLTVNAMVAAKGVIIPMQCEYYALEGLTALMETITGLRETINPALHIEGLLRTMYDPRMSLTTEVSRQLISHFGDQVYRTVIPRNVRLAEAPSHGKPVLSYDKTSRGAVAYLALAAELLKKHDAKKTRKKVGEY